MGISKSKKLLLVQYQNFCCEECKKKFKLNELEIHRIKRDWQGGTYQDFRNLKVVCKKCHKMFHFQEFPNIK